MLNNPSFLQPVLEDARIVLRPLKQEYFPALYRLSADPMLWERHPSPDRYKKPVFTNFLEGAISSGGALVAFDKDSGEVLGCSRYYDYNGEERSILIGYTFIGRGYWAQGINARMKRLMLDHIFKFVDKVYLHVGVNNINSNNAMRKLPATLVATEMIAYHGEHKNENNIYLITRDQWLAFTTVG